MTVMGAVGKGADLVWRAWGRGGTSFDLGESHIATAAIGTCATSIIPMRCRVTDVSSEVLL